MKSLLDPTFRYIPASRTNIANTFRRERQRIKEQAERDAQSPKVALIKRAGNSTK